MMESVNPNMKAGVSAVYTLFMQELHPFGVFGASTAPPRPPPPVTPKTGCAKIMKAGNAEGNLCTISISRKRTGISAKVKRGREHRQGRVLQAFYGPYMRRGHYGEGRRNGTALKRGKAGFSG